MKTPRLKKISFIFLFLAICFVSKAQIENPVEWEFDSKKVSGTTYEIHITAKLDRGWHIYSQFTPDGGPIATTITFNKNPLITLTGKAKEVGKLEQKHEPLFGVDVKQFSGKVAFIQTVTVKGNAKTAISGAVEFMVCDDERCLPPAIEKFSLKLN